MSGAPLSRWCRRRAPSDSRPAAFLSLLAATLVGLATHAADLPPGFTSDSVLHDLHAATALSVAPDGRVFIADQTGPLRVWKDGALLPEPALDLTGRVDDWWERGLIGVTLHPDFPRVPHLFVVYVARSPFTHHVISRFTLVGDRADPASERILLEGDDQAGLGGSVPAGHQGGIVRIGPDGFLYAGLGEQTAGHPSQSITTLQGKILRLRLDGTIPDDNPFYQGATGKYRAIWAIGIRNPFGLAFEPGSGRLFETDVGQTSFEEVNIITRGGNYGWPEAEGFSTNTAFINPIHAYPPAIGRSIVGGLFLPGNSTWPEKWRGRFFFADWANHWIKALNPANPREVVTFARSLNGPVALETGPDESLWVLNRGTIWRDGQKFVARSGSLVRIRNSGILPSADSTPAADVPIPTDLAATGLFSALTPPAPLADFTEFEINCPPWQPGIRATRWIRLPEGQTLTFSPTQEWELPEGTVVIQHFMISDGPRLGLPFETHITWSTGPRTVRAGAYRWSDSGTSATLIEDGEVVPLPGQPRRQWFSPGVEPNLNLDTVVTGFFMPLNTRQLNREVDDPREGTPVQQLHLWNRRGWLAPPISDTSLSSLPSLAALHDTNASLGLRVRSYLDVNCSACHRPGGLSRGQFDARLSTPFTEQRLLHGDLIAGDLGIPGAQVLVPGHPERSVLYRRVDRTDFFRMPPVNVNDEPQPIAPLLKEWILSLAR